MARPMPQPNSSTLILAFLLAAAAASPTADKEQEPGKSFQQHTGVPHRERPEALSEGLRDCSRVIKATEDETGDDDAEACAAAVALLQQGQQVVFRAEVAAAGGVEAERPDPRTLQKAAVLANPPKAAAAAADAADASPPSHWHPTIQAFYKNLQAESVSTPPASSVSLAQLDEGTEGNNSGSSKAELVIVLQSGADFYNTRLDWISKTWARNLNGQMLLAVGDYSPPVDAGVPTAPTNCPAHDHGQGGCCKTAEAVIAAYQLMQKEPSLQWAYVADDDTYIRVPELRLSLSRSDPNGQSGKGAAYGRLGCTTNRCAREGICGGGGYGLSRSAVSSLVGDNGPAAFLRQQMDTCSLCSDFADVALSQVLTANLVSIHDLHGLHASRMEKADFDKTLDDKSPTPLLYHYVRTQAQMSFLHALFHPKLQTKATTSLAEGKEQRAASARCATYQGQTHCASALSAALTEVGVKHAFPWGIPKPQGDSWLMQLWKKSGAAQLNFRLDGRFMGIA